MARNGKNGKKEEQGKRRNGNRRVPAESNGVMTTSTPSGAEPDRRVVELRNWYRERLPTRIAALQDARKQIVEKPTEGLDSVRRIAHSLRDSGATYGFTEITEAAR